MPRNAQGLSPKTRENKIKRLKKHVKKMTFAKMETQQVDGKLVTKSVTKYRGGQEALNKLKELESMK